MASRIFDPAVTQTITDAQAAARRGETKNVLVGRVPRAIPSPFPSPTDWRDTWIYFLLIDRFNNPAKPPSSVWNRRFDFRQGGTFKGVQAQLGYLEQLGVKALWLSPVLKNSKPNWPFNYHGYGQQDFLNIHERCASDGQQATAERELMELVDEAHARGMYVILDIVLNHSARVFDYLRPMGVVSSFADSSVMDGAFGTEPDIEWLNGFGFPRADWTNQLPPSAPLSPDDAVWPADLQNRLFFRRRGSKLTDDPGTSFVRGDFGDMRQLVVENDATVPGQEAVRARYGISPVIGILIRAYSYLIARYDVDGYRLDTVKYVDPAAVETFGNVIREFALSVGKKNFFTSGEVYDSEDVVARFVGRNGTGEGFGIDAALDSLLFFKLPGVAKRIIDVGEIRRVFLSRKSQEAELLGCGTNVDRWKACGSGA